MKLKSIALVIGWLICSVAAYSLFLGDTQAFHMTEEFARRGILIDRVDAIMASLFGPIALIFALVVFYPHYHFDW